jgi:hypothetical protein
MTIRVRTGGDGGSGGGSTTTREGPPPPPPVTLPVARRRLVVVTVVVDFFVSSCGDVPGHLNVDSYIGARSCFGYFDIYQSRRCACRPTPLGMGHRGPHYCTIGKFVDRRRRMWSWGVDPRLWSPSRLHVILFPAKQDGALVDHQRRRHPQEQRQRQQHPPIVLLPLLLLRLRSHCRPPPPPRHETCRLPGACLLCSYVLVGQCGTERVGVNGLLRISSYHMHMIQK